MYAALSRGVRLQQTSATRWHLRDAGAVELALVMPGEGSTASEPQSSQEQNSGQGMAGPAAVANIVARVLTGQVTRLHQKG